MHRAVNFLHERVEMHPPRWHIAHICREHIHQHRLAATHTTPKIQTLRWLGRALEKALFLRGHQGAANAVKLRQYGLLRGVRRQAAVGNAVIVNGA